MNQATIAQIQFKSWAKSKNLKHKVAGDYAYSSRPMGQGRYARLESVKNGKLEISYQGERIILDIIQPEYAPFFYI
jgi:hypothetical protein